VDHELGTSALRFEREGLIAWCVIDRPAARNALTPGMYYGIKRAVNLVITSPLTWVWRSQVTRVVPHDALRGAALEAAGEVVHTAPDARTHVKRMLNERYGLIDYQTMFWALEHSPEPREGMQAFMEKRSPNWVPDDA